MTVTTITQVGQCDVSPTASSHSMWLLPTDMMEHRTREKRQQSQSYSENSRKQWTKSTLTVILVYTIVDTAQTLMLQLSKLAASSTGSSCVSKPCDASEVLPHVLHKQAVTLGCSMVMQCITCIASPSRHVMVL